MGGFFIFAILEFMFYNADVFVYMIGGCRNDTPF